MATVTELRPGCAGVDVAPDPVAVRCTAPDALSNLVAVLELAADGHVRCGAATRFFHHRDQNFLMLPRHHRNPPVDEPGPEKRGASCKSLAYAKGMCTRIDVPHLGRDSISIMPFTRRARSCMLMSPKPPLLRVA